MRHFICSATAIIVCAISAEAQVASSCVPIPALRSLYTNDVKDLALERIYQIKSPDTNLLEVPQKYQDTIMGVVAAICNLHSQYEADSIFLNYCIHRWPAHPFMAPAIELLVDTNYSWAKQWAAGNTHTGNAAIDSFLQSSNISLQSRYFFYLGNYSYMFATLATNHPVNIKAVGDSLINIPGILRYQLSRVVGDGNRISYSKDSDAHISFTAGWGDCPAGCTAAKVWRYHVTLSNCNVSLDTIAVYNREPNWANRPNCQLIPTAIVGTTTQGNVSLFIYPNPATDVLRLSGNTSNIEFYRIVDAMGHLSAIKRFDGLSIPVSGLHTGLNTIIFTSHEGQLIMKKFLKR